ncbi:MAG: restriction endonuclease subunit S, partial [Anaerolineales bacterium]
MKWLPYSEYEESGVPWLGRIPDSWYVAPLKRGLARNDGGVWGEDFDDEGTIVLRSTEIALDGSWQIEEPARRQLTAKERKDGRLEVGDLLVTKSSGSALHLGKTAVVTEDVAAMNCCFSNFTQRLRVNTKLLPRCLFWILNCPVGRDQLVFLGTTTTGLANLNTEVIGAVQIPFSTLAEQRAIA